MPLILQVLTVKIWLHLRGAASLSCGSLGESSSRAVLETPSAECICHLAQRVNSRGSLQKRKGGCAILLFGKKLKGLKIEME
jgi:hypothetical protein